MIDKELFNTKVRIFCKKESVDSTGDYQANYDTVLASGVESYVTPVGSQRLNLPQGSNLRATHVAYCNLDKEEFVLPSDFSGRLLDIKQNNLFDIITVEQFNIPSEEHHYKIILSLLT